MRWIWGLLGGSSRDIEPWNLMCPLGLEVGDGGVEAEELAGET